MKRVLFPLLSLLLFLLLLWQGGVTADAVRQGLALCGRAVIPALFPFLFSVRFMIGLGLGQWLPPEIAAFVTGAVGGYPLGAATVSQLLREGQLPRDSAQRLLCCCNNAGGGFIVSFLGQSVFGSTKVGFLLWGVHLCSSLCMAALFFPRGRLSPAQVKHAPASADAFVDAVQSSADTMLRVCGFVVLFSVVTALLQAAGISSPLLLGALELTCGAGFLPASRRGFVIAAALLGWGGVSVHCQTAAVCAGSGLSPGRYMAAKALQSGISAALAWGAARWM